MSSKLVTKYHNDMNTIPFRKFNSNELNLFFSICSSVKEKGGNEVVYTFEYLKDLCNYKFTGLERFYNNLLATNEKLKSLSFRFENEDEIIDFVLFTTFKINKVKQEVKIKVNDEFSYILNNLTSNFTRFELEEFVSLKSSYSKAVYRLLKQFRNTGYYKVQIDEFKRLLDVPVSYDTTNFNKRVLAPIINELSCYFNKLKITKVRAKKGNKIEFLEFKFEKELAYVKGDKVFYKNKNNEYYSKSIYDLTVEEINQKFPEDEVDPNQTVIDDFL